ncbi:MAG: hypothetical protein ACE5KE_09285 [Methanosarcinales archaeon]
MLIDSSSIRHLQIIGLGYLVQEMDTVAPIIYEVGELKVRRVYEVSKKEVDSLIKYLETIAIQTGKQITIELKKTKRRSKSITLCPYGKKGRLSLHYGEFYLLAISVNYSLDILCDDETVAVIRGLLSDLCGINFEIANTFNFLYNLYRKNRISSSEFVDYFEKMIETKQLNLKIPAKTNKEKAILETLLKFMRRQT